MQHKKVLLAISVMAINTVLMTGCTSVSAGLGNYISKKANLASDPDYQQYLQMKQDGKLDEDNNYIMDEISEVEPEVHTGSVHVTFANNRFLTIDYYSDREHKNRIDSRNCYLNPGDTIYSSSPITNNPNSNQYSLSEYRIYKYEDNQKMLIDTVDASEGILAYRIPKEFDGTELSILPIGKYEDRIISVNVYYTDDDGNHINLPGVSVGTWYVNNEIQNSESIRVGAVDDYILSFRFDNKNYFYVSSTPSCFTQNPQDCGLVEFLQADANDTTEDYSVELQRYFSYTISCNQPSKIYLSGEDPEKVKKCKTKTISDLKYGDTIIVETNGTVSIDQGDYRHIKAEKNPIQNGYRYELSVSDKAASINAPITDVVDVNKEYTVTLKENANYGTCTYKLDGKTVSGEQKIHEDQKLEMTYKITDKDYEFEDKSGNPADFVFSIVKGPERTIKINVGPELDNKTIEPDEYVSIVKKDGE